jgi:DNA-binding LacI/PurR family transcriptional regulator
MELASAYAGMKDPGLSCLRYVGPVQSSVHCSARWPCSFESHRLLRFLAVVTPGAGDALARRDDGRDGSRATIRSVAERAGVSKSLVSLVFRDAPNVSKERRQAVLRAAEELGYRPNLIARSLSESRTGLIGVLASELHNPFFTEVIDGAQSAAYERELTLLLGTGRRHGVEEAHVIEQFLQHNVDGLLLLAPRVDAGVLGAAARTVPSVIVAQAGPRVPRCDIVLTDEDVGAHLAVGHLVELGHREIAYLSGGKSIAAVPRQRAYEQAMRDAGLTDFVEVVDAEDTDAAGARAMAGLLRRGRRPTAVFAFNDYAAVGAMTAIEDAGLRVPVDISVIGYDNTFLAGIPQISMTSIHQPRAEMGRLAVEVLAARAARPTAPARVRMLTPHLVPRATTAQRRSG